MTVVINFADSALVNSIACHYSNPLDISSSDFLCLLLGQRGQLLKKMVSPILFLRWPPPSFKACVRTKSRLLSPIVLKLCTSLILLIRGTLLILSISD